MVEADADAATIVSGDEDEGAINRRGATGRRRAKSFGGGEREMRRLLMTR